MDDPILGDVLLIPTYLLVWSLGIEQHFVLLSLLPVVRKIALITFLMDVVLVFHARMCFSE